MTATVASRELRNHTNEILQRVREGEELEILQNNVPVAKLVPIDPRRPMTGADLMRFLEERGAYPGDLKTELAEVLDDRMKWLED
jgi:prevent-host-death family protein